MKVLLVGPDYEENLSIRYLSSSLQAAGHDTTLGAFNFAEDIDIVEEQAESADLVGLSMCFQTRAEEFLRLARRIKSRDRNKLIVAGGHYASCAASPLLENRPELDVIVIHEGEQALVEIADGLPQWRDRLPKIPGIVYRDGQQVRFTEPRRTIDDLDSLPFPDRRGRTHWIAGVPTSYLMGSRGCYGSCAYCCITSLHRMAPGKRFRQRDPERIADEMAELYRERGTRQFVFHDDNFLVPSEALNHARLAAFEKALKQRRVKDIALVIKCRPADASRDVMRRLKDMGLVRVFMGIESSTERGLATLERQQTMDDSVRALELCAELEISAQFTMMIFNPDATVETLRSDVAFMRRFCGNPELLPDRDLRWHSAGETHDRLGACSRRLPSASVQHAGSGGRSQLQRGDRPFRSALLGERQPDAACDRVGSRGVGAEAVPSRAATGGGVDAHRGVAPVGESGHDPFAGRSD